MTTAREVLDSIPTEDKLELAEALMRMQLEGVKEPMIPLNVDLDNDGIADAFALDHFSCLIIRNPVDEDQRNMEE